MYQKSDVEGAIPLLFCHGRKTPRFYPLQSIDTASGPASFLEVTKILHLLTTGGKDTPAFHIIASSLPNYGFSSGTKKKGFGLPQYAKTCYKLMLKLGYEKYSTLTPTSHHGAFI